VTAKKGCISILFTDTNTPALWPKSGAMLGRSLRTLVERQDRQNQEAALRQWKTLWEFLNR
jgi:cystathionine beta-lyase/cystathionine gamma-synthase